MKITQEVRAFARGELAERPGDVSPARARDFADGEAVTEADADEGMAEMSKRFHDEGGELYVPTGVDADS